MLMRMITGKARVKSRSGASAACRERLITSVQASASKWLARKSCQPEAR